MNIAPSTKPARSRRGRSSAKPKPVAAKRTMYFPTAAPIRGRQWSLIGSNGSEILIDVESAVKHMTLFDNLVTKVTGRTDRGQMAVVSLKDSSTSDDQVVTDIKFL